MDLSLEERLDLAKQEINEVLEKYGVELFTAAQINIREKSS